MTGGGEQSVVIAEINNKLIGFKIEMLFNYTHDQGLSWCHGEVIGIKDAKKKTVIVRWAEEHVGEGEKSERILKLLDNKWNKSQEGGMAGIFNRIIDFILERCSLEHLQCINRGI